MKIKKKRLLIVISIAVAAVIVVCAWLLFRPKALGNINAGDLEIKLYDSNDNEVYVLDHAKVLKTFYTFEHSDTYTLKAEYTDFTGDFKIAVYPAK